MFRDDKDRRTLITGEKPGIKHLRAQQLRHQSTRAGALLWYHLRAGRLDGLHFRRQQVIDGFIADFYCHEVGLVVEVDGAIHGERAEYDAERDRILRERGLRILRITNAEVTADRPSALAKIRAAARGGL